MNIGNVPTFTGVVIGEEETVTLDELARLCTVEKRWVVELVEHGALEPLDLGADEWRFSGWALHRVRTAARLHWDLELGGAGVALALDLLDEIEALRAQLRAHGG